MNDPSKPQPADSGRTIVVSVDGASHLRSAIDLAVALASATHSTLHGLFVQDSELLSVAKLPFAQEVPLLGGRPRSFDDRQLQRSLDQLARQFRQILENQARPFSLTCSHSVVQGCMRRLELGDAVQPDFLVLGQPQRGLPRVAYRRRILLLIEQLRELAPALELILGKTPGMHTELLLIGSPEGGGGPEQKMLSEVPTGHPELQPVVVPEDQLERVLGLFSPRGDCVLALSNMDAGRLNRIMQLAPCPVVLVRPTV